MRFFLAAAGVGFLLTGSMGMLGLYRGVLHDALLTIEGIGADLWVVQGGRAGPFAEASVVSATLDRRVEGVAGVTSARRFVQNNLQFDIQGKPRRIAITGLDFPKDQGAWLSLAEGRLLQSGRGEAIADASLGLSLGQDIRLGRDSYRVVGVTSGQVDMSGDGQLFVTIPDAMDIADSRTPETVLLERAQGLGVSADRPSRIAAVVVTTEAGMVEEVARIIGAWGDVAVLSREDQRSALVDGRLWRLRMQILFFTILLLTVTGVVIAMTIYTSTLEKLHEIAMLKLIGARDGFILRMILEQAVLIGLFAYGLALLLSTLLFRFFPRNVVLLAEDLTLVFGGLLLACVVGSWIGIERAMRVRAKEVLA
ncbi:ABC transporter permease [Falsiroseomonas selenitidurans]|uniref:ABC transporter permease n=1 Tax=Falsiroseomonas selenitidurans TaxID=2716335 RepID=A0ABX1E3T7_9PROT|nr:ABC transporter permease [Falsiroseomonas selenitidurans]NKC31671.1 ABC transporter permease [Falsiroseomonas selenitidurans]